MNRLTRDLNTPHDDTTYADIVKDCVDRENIVLTKLKHFEDIEDEIDVDLEVLFKALKNGFFVKKDTINEGLISLVKAKDIRSIDLVTHNIFFNDKNLVFFENYGKTWALTKEELKEE